MRQKDTTHWTIERASKGSSEEMKSIAAKYYSKTGYSQIGDFDVARWCEIWECFVQDDWSDAFIARSGDKIAGFAMIQVSHEFIKDAYLGDVYQFYIDDAYFGTGLSRDLSKNIDDWFTRYGCKANFVSCAAAMGEKNNLLFFNLWGKLGYCKLGTEMIKFNGR